MTPKQLETVKFVAIAVMGFYITSMFIVAYLRGRLSTPFFLRALLFIVPSWLTMFVVWRRLRRGGAANRPPM